MEYCCVTEISTKLYRIIYIYLRRVWEQRRKKNSPKVLGVVIGRRNIAHNGWYKLVGKHFFERKINQFS